MDVCFDLSDSPWLLFHGCFTPWLTAGEMSLQQLWSVARRLLSESAMRRDITLCAVNNSGIIGEEMSGKDPPGEKGKLSENEVLKF